MGKSWKVIEYRFWKETRKSLSITILVSVIKANKNYYPQTLLEECKYIQEKIITENYTDDDLKSDNESDNGTSDE